MKPARLILSTLLTVLAGVAPAAAEIVPLGPERVVNQETEGNQHAPSLASLGPAGMVAVWATTEFDAAGFKARLLDASGNPVSDDFWVVPGRFISAFPEEHGPRVAGAGSGIYVVVWEDFGVVWARLYLRDQPLGDALQVGTGYVPVVAMDATGNFVVVWLERQNRSSDYILQARRYSADGTPVGGAVRVNQSRILDSTSAPAVALHADGGFLVAWPVDRIVARRFDGTSQSWADEVILGAGYKVATVLYPEGDGAVVWDDSMARKIEARWLDPAGSPLGDILQVSPSVDPRLPVGIYSPAVALDTAGNALVVWKKDERIMGRLLDRSWKPLAETFALDSGEFPAELPAVVASPSGGFTTVWGSGRYVRYDPTISRGPSITGRDGSGLGIVGRSLSGLCSADAEALCLGPGGRFAARVSWRLPSGQEGKGRPLALTRDTGAFWFFGAENLELMLKILDGRGHNGSFWVYAAALSDVEYTLVVRDTVTGEEKTYSNPQGRLASRSDVDAFPAPGAPAPDAASAFAAAESLSLGDGGRFQVTVEFLDPRNGLLQKATAIPLTRDTGAFWFFDARNIELMIKILDGRGHNGHFWIYYGALSDVEYTITVTDTATGEKRTYENAPGRLVSRSDVDAFPLP